MKIVTTAMAAIAIASGVFVFIILIIVYALLRIASKLEDDLYD